MAELSIDEISEFGLYDSESRVKRKELLKKKARKVHKGTPITVRLSMKNILGTSLMVKNVRLVCRLAGEDGDLPLNQQYIQESQSVQLSPHRSNDIILTIVPQKEGELEIQSVEWEIFEVVRCKRSLQSISSDF